MVSIHRDECCVKKKGYCFMPIEDRRAVIEAIKYVDEVVVCGENTQNVGLKSYFYREEKARE